MSSVLAQSEPGSAEHPPPRPGTAPTGIGRRQLVLFPARLFLAMGWLRAGAEKLIDETWWTGSYLDDFLIAQQDTMLPFLQPVVSYIDGGRTAVAISLIVLVLELALGVCFATAKHLPQALRAAIVLNVVFVALGVVSPSAFYLVIQLTLLLELGVRQPVDRRTAGVIIAVSIATAAAMAPFVRTLHPHGVIDDPAIMLATLALLYAATMLIVIVTDAHDRDKPAVRRRLRNCA